MSEDTMETKTNADGKIAISEPQTQTIVAQSSPTQTFYKVESSSRGQVEGLKLKITNYRVPNDGPKMDTIPIKYRIKPHEIKLIQKPEPAIAKIVHVRSLTSPASTGHKLETQATIPLKTEENKIIRVKIAPKIPQSPIKSINCSKIQISPFSATNSSNSSITEELVNSLTVGNQVKLEPEEDEVSSNQGKDDSLNLEKSVKMSREMKCLRDMQNNSKILTGYMVETDRMAKVRKSRKKNDDDFVPASSFIQNRSQSVSSTSQIEQDPDFESPESEGSIQKRANMRSANIEFTLKQRKFLSQINHASDEEDDDDEDGEVPDDDTKSVKSTSTNMSLIQPNLVCVNKSVSLPVGPKDGWDKFCWRCNSNDTILIPCSTCVRCFHGRCMKVCQAPMEGKDWKCPECIELETVEIADKTKAGKEKLKPDYLTTLLKFSLRRMQNIRGSNLFKSFDKNLYPNYDDFVTHHMDLDVLDQNLNSKKYSTLESFSADARWMLHNSIVYPSNNKLLPVAKLLAKTIKQELIEIDACHECYNKANTIPDWFIAVCSKPHVLVWAKLKGFPFWPAKVLSITSANLVDVRFFGAHDRAWVALKDCFLFSEKDPNTTIKQKTEILNCIKEAESYIKNLSALYGHFHLADFRTPLDCNLDGNLEKMLPGYFDHQKSNLVLKIVKSADNSLSVSPLHSTHSHENGEFFPLKIEVKKTRSDETGGKMRFSSNETLKSSDEKVETVILKRKSESWKTVPPSKRQCRSTDEKIESNTKHSKKHKNSNISVDTTITTEGKDLIECNGDKKAAKKIKLSSPPPPPEAAVDEEKKPAENLEKEDEKLNALKETELENMDTSEDLSKSKELSKMPTSPPPLRMLTESERETGSSVEEKDKGTEKRPHVPIPEIKTEIVDPTEEIIPSPEQTQDNGSAVTIKTEPLSEDEIENVVRSSQENGETQNNQPLASSTPNSNQRVTVKDISQLKNSNMPKLPAGITIQPRARKTFPNKPITPPLIANKSSNIAIMVQIPNANVTGPEKTPPVAALVNGTTAPITVQPPANENHMMSGYITPTLASAITEIIAPPPPKLVTRPTGALRSDGTCTQPAEAGPLTTHLIENSHKMADFFRIVIEDTLADLSSTGHLEARVRILETDIEKLKHDHKQELSKLKNNSDLILTEMRKSLENEKTKIINETRKQCDIERLKAIAETKKKQWCINCGKEANLYCCWGTSYCDYPCQQVHWPQHMKHCNQINMQRQQQQTTATQVTLQKPVKQVLAFPKVQQANQLHSRQSISGVRHVGPQILAGPHQRLVSNNTSGGPGNLGHIRLQQSKGNMSTVVSPSSKPVSNTVPNNIMRTIVSKNPKGHTVHHVSVHPNANRSHAQFADPHSLNKMNKMN